MAIGKKLETLLQIKHIKPGTLAATTGINKNTIYSIIKRDNEMVNMGTLDKIANALGVSIDYFFDDDVEMLLETAEKKQLVDLNELDEKDREFVDLFVTLSPTNRTLFLEIARAILKAQGAPSDSSD